MGAEERKLSDDPMHRLRCAVMDADRAFQAAGESSTRTWLSEYLVPAMAEHRVKVEVIGKVERKMRSNDVLEQASLFMSFAAALFGDLVWQDNSIDTGLRKLDEAEDALRCIREALEKEKQRLSAEGSVE